MGQLRETDVVISGETIEEFETEEDFEKHFLSVLAENGLSEDNAELFYKPDDSSIVLRKIDDNGAKATTNKITIS